VEYIDISRRLCPEELNVQVETGIFYILLFWEALRCPYNPQPLSLLPLDLISHSAPSTIEASFWLRPGL